MDDVQNLLQRKALLERKVQLESQLGQDNERSVGDFLGNKLPSRSKKAWMAVASINDLVARPKVQPIDDLVATKPQNPILSMGAEGAKSAFRTMMPGNDMAASFINEGLASQPLQRGIQESRNVGKYISRNVPETPNLPTPLGGINPKSVVNFLGTTASDPRTIAMASAPAGELATGLKGAGEVGMQVLNDVKRIPGQAFNAMKSAPRNLLRGVTRPFTKIGSEITPKVEGLVTSRIKSMNPEALNAIGVSPESNRIAQEVGQRVGLEELPSKTMADKYYQIASDSIPEDVKIPTTNLEKAISDPANQSRATQEIGKLLKRSNLDEMGVMQKTPLSKLEYQNIRKMLNNLDPTGETPAIQAVKHALDADAGTVSPEVAKANGTFQVSRELGKANKYIEKPNLGSSLQKQLEEGGKMGNVQKRAELSKLIGPEAKNIFKDIGRTKGLQRLIAAAGSVGLFGGLYKGFNAVTGGHHNIHGVE